MSALTRLPRADDMFPAFFRGFMRPSWPSEAAAAEMKVDISENDGAYLVKAEIPGAKKDDIRIDIDGNFVSISAEVKEEQETKEPGRALMRELYYGSLARGFSLAHEINDREAVARFDDGVLSLMLPKRREARGTTLKIA